MSFDTFIMVDWSGGNDRGAAPKKDAIWACVAGEAPVYLRSRAVAEAWIVARIEAERAAGRRVLLGFDFPFGYPAGFAKAVTGRADPFALWEWFEARVEDAPKANNRFDLAGELNEIFSGVGPFWGNGLKRDIWSLPRKGRAREGHGMSERRLADDRAVGAFTCWQMSGAGSVGGQMIMGLPVLARLRRRFSAKAWPFEPWRGADVLLVEVWPSLLSGLVKAEAEEGEVKDAAQVRLLARQMAGLSPDALAEMLDAPAGLPAPEATQVREEGWIFGLGAEDVLAASVAPERQVFECDGPAGAGWPEPAEGEGTAEDARLKPPPLRDDCFALPGGVDWTPVDEALEALEARLRVVVGQESLPLQSALGRVLAVDVTAKRAHPPEANAAVDGYGFAHRALGEGDQLLPLLQGRSAAGVPFDGVVPEGAALRILTGASLPDGVDTVILQEDVTASAEAIAFRAGIKQGANTRAAGEDVAQDAPVLPKGRRVTPADLALMAAVGVSEVPVFKPLRAGVLSTGDELVEAGTPAQAGQIYDANRPMLLGLAAQMGHQPVDLGRAPDDRKRLREMLSDAAQNVDVILTSGGASAGDEDHLSALLRAEGAMQDWRIAVKPGRPLALGMWQGTPVFGLPGNPVAAFVCMLVFARPALGLMAGAGWLRPEPVTLPAAFHKRKKPGRREYLRARVRGGVVEIFASEGSGRISGLSWAEGLVELPDGQMTIEPGDPVSYLPFSAFF